MGTRTTTSNFLVTIKKEVPKYFSTLGFVQGGPGMFWRKCGAVDHGFMFAASPRTYPTCIRVEVGADVPALSEQLEYGRRSRYKSLLVSRPLYLLGKEPAPEKTYYHFATVEQLREVLPLAYADFIERAEPWLAELVTVEDVAREFHKWRVAPPPNGYTRPPDPFAWAIYGWLLQQTGNELAGKPWLERALDQLKEPAFWMKGGAFVPIGTKGARPVPRRPEELRLIELLKKDLDMDN